MALDIDQFPVYDTLVKLDTGKMSDVWVSSMSSFVQTLIGYLSQNGIFIPRLDNNGQKAITKPENGQIIYNTDTNSFLGYQGGSWKTFTLT